MKRLKTMSQEELVIQYFEADDKDNVQVVQLAFQVPLYASKFAIEAMKKGFVEYFAAFTDGWSDQSKAILEEANKQLDIYYKAVEVGKAAQANKAKQQVAQAQGAAGIPGGDATAPKVEEINEEGGTKSGGEEAKDAVDDRIPGIILSIAKKLGKTAEQESSGDAGDSAESIAEPPNTGPDASPDDSHGVPIIGWGAK